MNGKHAIYRAQKYKTYMYFYDEPLNVQHKICPEGNQNDDCNKCSQISRQCALFKTEFA